MSIVMMSTARQPQEARGLIEAIDGSAAFADLDVMRMNMRFPHNDAAFIARCHAAGQPTRYATPIAPPRLGYLCAVESEHHVSD